jgi:hypothetical protein
VYTTLAIYSCTFFSVSLVLGIDASALGKRDLTVTGGSANLSNSRRAISVSEAKNPLFIKNSVFTNPTLGAYQSR